MFKVSTQNLSPDGATADARFGLQERGDLDPATLAALLEKLARIDAVQNHEYDPQVMVQVRDHKYLIRTSSGKLHVYNARNTSQPGVELALPALLALLGSTAPLPVSPADETPALAPAAARSKSRGGLAAVLLFIGVGLNAWGIYQFLHREEDPPPPAYTPVTDPVQTAVLARQLIGIYATGYEAGDRVITIAENGGVQFHLLVAGPAGALVPGNQTSDTYIFGQRSGGLNCLATAKSGQIDVGVDGSLLYFGDTYRRPTRAK